MFGVGCSMFDVRCLLQPLAFRIQPLAFSLLFARVLEYADFRNFITVITKAREACVNSGHPVSDHFVDITEMVGIGSGAQREVEDWALSRYAC
jgi:hypothetical protein